MPWTDLGLVECEDHYVFRPIRGRYLGKVLKMERDDPLTSGRDGRCHDRAGVGISEAGRKSGCSHREWVTARSARYFTASQKSVEGKIKGAATQRLKKEEKKGQAGLVEIDTYVWRHK
jgi:hypothetical protein